MKKIIVGIDVGNYDTKTQHTTIPSSYLVSEQENKLTDEKLYFNGKYYSLTRQRNNQMLDKTENNYCIIMSLFAIANEIIWEINKGESIILSDEQMQEAISEYDEVIIGAGLPVGHFSSLFQKTIQCYMDTLSGGFEFVFKKWRFRLRLTKCRVYPQDFTAVACNPNVTTSATYSEYYIIGIGGGTVDIIPVIGGEPQVQSCKSIEKGTTFMYEFISTSMQQETGRNMDYTAIEAILKGERSIIDEKRKARVRELANDFATKLVDDLIHAGLRLSDYPCVMVGGGALLMKESLHENSQFALLEFVEDVNVNAKFFAAFVEEG